MKKYLFKLRDIGKKGLTLLLCAVLLLPGLSLLPGLGTKAADESTPFSILGLNTDMSRKDAPIEELNLPYGEQGKLTEVNEVLVEWASDGTNMDRSVAWGIGGKLLADPSRSTGYQQTHRTNKRFSTVYAMSTEGDFDGDGQRDEIAYLDFYVNGSTGYYRADLTWSDYDGRIHDDVVESISIDVKASSDNLKKLWDKAHILAADVNGDGRDEIIVAATNRIHIFSRKEPFGTGWHYTPYDFDTSSLTYFKGDKDNDAYKVNKGPSMRLDGADNGGATVSIATGDINNDGYDDIAYVVSAICGNPAGTVCTGSVLFGAPQGSRMVRRSLPMPNAGIGKDASPAPGRLGITITRFDEDRYLDILLAWEEIADIRHNKDDIGAGGDGFVAKYYNVNWIQYSFPKDVTEIGKFEKPTQVLSKAATVASGHSTESNKSYKNLTHTAALRIAKANILRGDGTVSPAVMINGAVHLIEGKIINQEAWWNFTDPNAKDGEKGLNNNTTVYSIRTGTTNGKYEGFLVHWVKNKKGTWNVVDGGEYSLTENRKCVAFWNGQVIEYANQQKLEVPQCASLPDLDKDSILVEFVRHEFYYSDPKVGAVLAAPPYYKDLQGAGVDYSTDNATTEIVFSKETSTGSIEGHQVSAGAYAKVEFEGGLFANGQFESELSYHHTWNETTEQTKATGFSRGFSANVKSKDMVLLYTIPMDVYVYKALVPAQDGGNARTEEEMLIMVPYKGSVNAFMSLEEYEKKRLEIQRLWDEKSASGGSLPDLLPDVSDALSHVPGDPRTYPSTKQQLEQHPHYKEDSLLCDDDEIITVSDNGDASSGIVVSEVTSKQTINADSVDVTVGGGAGWEAPGISEGKVVFGANIGYEYSYGKVVTDLTSTSMTGTVTGTPTGYSDDYKFTFQLVSYTYQMEKEGEGDDTIQNEFPVVTYLVTNPTTHINRLPYEYGVLKTEATNESVKLWWQPSPDDKQPGKSNFTYNVYRLMPGWERENAQKVEATAVWNNGEQRYEMTVRDLEEATEHNFVLTVGPKAAESADSQVFSAFTRSSRGANFDTHPQPLAIPLGESAQMTATLEGTYASVLYQWQQKVTDFDAPPLYYRWEDVVINDNNINALGGANTNTLTFKAADLTQYQNSYRLKAVVKQGEDTYSIYSEPASMTFLLPDALAPVAETVTHKSITASVPKLPQMDAVAGSKYYQLHLPNWWGIFDGPSEGAKPGQETITGSWRAASAPVTHSGLLPLSYYTYNARYYMTTGGYLTYSEVSVPLHVKTKGPVIQTASVSYSGAQVNGPAGDGSYAAVQPGEVTAAMTGLTFLDAEDGAANAALDYLKNDDLEYKWQKSDTAEGAYTDLTDWAWGKDGGSSYEVAQSDMGSYLRVMVRHPECVGDTGQPAQGVAATQVLLVDIPAVTGVTINEGGSSRTVSITENHGQAELTASVLPAGASQDVTWSVVQGGDYVTVRSNGVVCAQGLNTQTGQEVLVRATSNANPDHYDEVYIVLSNQTVLVDNITISGGDTITNPNGGKLQLYATASPSNAANRAVTWSVEAAEGHTPCVTVSASGLVTATGAGEAVVVASAKDGSGATASTTVYVTAGQIDPAAAQVENVTISGTVDAPLAPQNAVVTLQNDAVIPGGLESMDAAGWFSALPDGVAVTASAAGAGNTITLSFAGTPTEAFDEPLGLTIPAGVLAGNTALAVAPNAHACFAIHQQAPQPLATISDGVIEGSVGAETTPTGFTITLQNLTVAEAIVDADVTSWFADLPGSGLSVKANAAAGGSTIAVEISGQAEQSSTALLNITIPGAVLSSGQALGVVQNNNARFAITEGGGTLPALTGSFSINNSSPMYGDVLELDTSELSATEGATGLLYYQWLREGQPIAGALDPVYTVVGADIGYTLTAIISAEKCTGSSSVTTSPVAKRQLTADDLNFTADDAEYTGAGPFVYGTNKPGVGKTTYSITNVGAEYPNVGLYTVAADVEEGAYYAAASGLALGSFEITRAAAPTGVDQTLEVAADSPDTYSFDLERLLPGLSSPMSLGGVTYSLKGVEDPDNILAASPVISDTDGNPALVLETAQVSAGVQNAVVTIEVESGNFEAFTAAVTLEVVSKTPVSIVGVTMSGKTYDGLPAGYAGLPVVLQGTTQVEDITLEVLYESTDGNGYSSVQPPTDAGAYRLTLRVPKSDENYTGNAVFAFTIGKKQVTVAASSHTIKQGGALPTPSVSYSGFVSGHNEGNVLATRAVATHTVTDSATVGQHEIGFAALAALNTEAGKNYTLSHQTGTLTVTSKSTAKDIVSVVLPAGATLSGTAITAEVPSNASSQAVDVMVSPDASWKLFSDSGFTQEIASKTLSLKTGVNYAYILVTAEDGSTRGYSMAITRLELVRYTLVVSNGSGSGSYEAGTRVSISANPAPANQVFDRWVVTGGGTLDNSGSAATTFTMPDNAAAVTALYKNAESNKTIIEVPEDDPGDEEERKEGGGTGDDKPIDEKPDNGDDDGGEENTGDKKDNIYTPIEIINTKPVVPKGETFFIYAPEGSLKWDKEVLFGAYDADRGGYLFSAKDGVSGEVGLFYLDHDGRDVPLAVQLEDLEVPTMAPGQKDAKDGWPWWAWLLIVLAVMVAAAAGVVLLTRHGKKQTSKEAAAQSGDGPVDEPAEG